jgi:hypothetical protein
MKKRNDWHLIQAENAKLKEELNRVKNLALIQPAYEEMCKALGLMFNHNVLSQCKSRAEVVEAMEKQFGRVWYPWMLQVRDYHCNIFKLPFRVPSEIKEEEK